MFGIGGGEIIFILLVVLMLFGSDKIPEIARKLMAQLKNATNDIKSEIQKGVDGVVEDSSFSEISSEITKAKENLISTNTSTITKIKEDIDEVTGPIKRQL